MGNPELILGQGGQNAMNPQHNPDVSHHRLYESWLGVRARIQERINGKSVAPTDKVNDTDPEKLSPMFIGDYSGLLLAGILIVGLVWTSASGSK